MKFKESKQLLRFFNVATAIAIADNSTENMTKTKTKISLNIYERYFVASCKEMHNSIGIIAWERLYLIKRHRVIHFSFEKEHSATTAETFYKIEQPLITPTGDPFCTHPRNVWLVKCLIHHVRNSEVYFCTN